MSDFTTTTFSANKTYENRVLLKMSWINVQFKPVYTWTWVTSQKLILRCQDVQKKQIHGRILHKAQWWMINDRYISGSA